MVPRNARPLLSCRQLSLNYGSRKIFSDLTFAIYPREFWVISGESGIGKSSLLKIINGVQTSFSGTLEKPAAWSEIPQGLSLCAGLSAREAIATGSLQYLPWWRTLFGLPQRHLQRADRMAQSLGISHVVHADVARLSGGERQRTAIARALMTEAQLFLMDEPISMLDENRAVDALEILRGQAYGRGGSVLCVLHQPALIERFATHRIVLGPTEPNGWAVS